VFFGAIIKVVMMGFLPNVIVSGVGKNLGFNDYET
jgi:hypothetical protein